MGLRTPNTVRRSSGRRTVNYRHTDGNTHTAIVTGGTGDSLNLKVPSLPKSAMYKTGAAKMTTPKQTNVWMNRV